MFRSVYFGRRNACGQTIYLFASVKCVRSLLFDRCPNCPSDGIPPLESPTMSNLLLDTEGPNVNSFKIKFPKSVLYRSTITSCNWIFVRFVQSNGPTKNAIIHIPWQRNERHLISFELTLAEKIKIQNERSRTQSSTHFIVDAHATFISLHSCHHCRSSVVVVAECRIDRSLGHISI